MSLSTEEVCAYLKEQISFISEGILERFVEHKIDGEVFLQLNDEYLREIAPLVGDRLKLKKIINKALAESLVSHFLYVVLHQSVSGEKDMVGVPLQLLRVFAGTSACAIYPV